ncbi:MAG: cellulase family glycosylhydrolase [Ruminococcus sp.]|nr:cellulase family glycosylhydrolase [Ruminococcus sp.]
MKRLLALLAASALLLAGCGGSDSSSAAESKTDSKTDSVPAASGESTESNAASAASSVKGFSVSGTKLLDANGNEFVMRGVNHAHCWFASDDPIALDAIDKTGANCVRLVLADGVQWNKDSVESINALVEKCREYQMIAVLEVHDATGKDSIDDLEKASDFWIEMKDALIGKEDIVILNIANEWIGQWKSKTWADGYTSVIPKLREAGIKNTIMVDAAGWGQYGKSIKEKGKEVFDSDPDKNTMFSIHMYGSAGKNEDTIKDNLTGVTDQDLCVCVGEFGYNHSDGDVDEGFIMDYCQENSIGWLGWSWKGNGGGVEYLDLSFDWEGTQLSPDWGEVLVNGEKGIKATSKTCSVFAS